MRLSEILNGIQDLKAKGNIDIDIKNISCNSKKVTQDTLFVAIKVGRTTLSKTIPYMLWYYIAILIGLLLVTYVPFISMGLPTLAGLV